MSTCPTCRAPLPDSAIKGLAPLLCAACEARCPPALVAANHAAAEAVAAVSKADGRAFGIAMAEVERTARACVEGVGR